MATKKIHRLACECEACGHPWVARDTSGAVPLQCPACGARRRQWNASEETAGSASSKAPRGAKKRARGRRKAK